MPLLDFSRCRALLVLLAFLPLGAGDAAAGPPPEGECPSVVGAPLLEDGKGLVDAPPTLLKEGMRVDADQLLMLRRLLPPIIWQHREVFFYEGMRMEIGACHARYPSFGPYRAATDRFAGRPSLDKKNNLKGHVAGLPFPPESIDPEDEQAAAKWAWNLAQRHRGAGFRGRFRLTEIPARLGGILTYEGTFFFLKTSHRADLAEQDYALEGQESWEWAAGGEFSSPFDARHLAWRQFRSVKTLRDYEAADSTFVYVPSMRKMRRGATNWVDGLYVPSYTSGGEGGGGSMVYGEAAFGGGGGGGSISPNAGVSIQISQDKGHGLTGIILRPNAYVWRYLGEQTVLAPVNVTRDGFPGDPKRNFGTSGLSIASDRWDVRHAVIIEGALRIEGSDVRTLEIWMDYQTQQPLYWITRTGKRRLLDIGILAHRFSGDIAGYPEWPGGIPSNVFEPVAATFYSAISGGGGWRREAYDVRSTPFDDDDRRMMTSADSLQHGR